MAPPIISVVIPCRADEDAGLTLDSLSRQTIQGFETRIVLDVDGKGAPWARNVGAAAAQGEYLLFSDNDICWEPDALETMLTVLSDKRRAEACDYYKTGWVTGYAYGGKIITDMPDGGTIGPAGNEPWNYAELTRRNLIDTGALIARGCFPGWDESLKRLQDWDLWLTMAHRRIRGEWVGRVLYTTPYRKHGISFDGSGISLAEATAIVRRKHSI